MSMLLKWVIAIVVLVGIGWLFWWSGWLRNTNSHAMQAAVGSSMATTTTQASSTPATLNGMSAASDSSNAAIAQDVAAVDVQMQGLSKDDTQVTASFNDTPITQSY
jgi:predicted negative regulator of RcsB-dependent stress response